MPAASSRKAFELARTYRAQAKKVDDYVMANLDELSADDFFELTMLATNLSQLGATASFAGAKLDLNGMAEAAAEVTKVTADMEAALDNLDAVESVIDAVTSSVALVGAVASGNPRTVLAATKELADKVKAIAS